ncbi:plastin-3 [Hydra vulgaris]|uniref:Plastin-3 n=1 Tax=Hydra vulgaris TaxID=6087 RepID=A0ABM4BXR1_HYDVU
MADKIPKDVLAEITEAFNEIDVNKNGSISTKELGSCFAKLGENVPGYRLREIVQQVDKDKNGTIELQEFIELYCSVTTKGVFGQWTSKIVAPKDLTKVGGTSEASADGTAHSSSHAEEIAFKDWINSELKNDIDCKTLLPIKSADELFEKLSNGIIFCKMINLSVKGTIDERVINKVKLNAFLIRENNALAVNSANAIGCSVVNIGPEDIAQGKRHLVLGLLWQIIRIGLFSKISLAQNPNIAALCEDGETIDDLMKLTTEELLLRWVNYHLAKSGSAKRIKNFSGDIKDSEAYAILLNQIAPGEAHVDRPEHIISSSDHTKRAEMLLRNADKINCRKFLTAKDIVSGNSKLNLAFVAHLFNTHPTLDASDMNFEIYVESREEKTYRCWMNSLGVSPFVNHLYNGLNNGLVLFQLFDAIRNGTVNWDKVNKAPFKAIGGKMKKVENCNYVIELGKANKYSLVGIGGEDIHNETHTLVLALVWQMLRDYSIEMINKLSKAGAPTKDAEIVQWVNKKLSDAGKTSSITSFKDPSISTSLAVIDLVDAIVPESIQYDLVTKGENEEERLMNALYAISMCRKIGARTYALAEDLVEVKPKMVLTVFASLVARGLEG